MSCRINKTKLILISTLVEVVVEVEVEPWQKDIFYKIENDKASDKFRLFIFLCLDLFFQAPKKDE